MGGHGTHMHSGSHSHGTDGWGDTIFGPDLRLAEGPGPFHLGRTTARHCPYGRGERLRLSPRRCPSSHVTGWGSYRFANWISASIGGLYTEQGKIEGHYHASPPDLQFNYGGSYWDIGFGINTVVPSGTCKGLRLSAEWLQPVDEDVNGCQLEQNGTLWANASMAF